MPACTSLAAAPANPKHHSQRPLLATLTEQSCRAAPLGCQIDTSAPPPPGVPTTSSQLHIQSTTSKADLLWTICKEYLVDGTHTHKRCDRHTKRATNAQGPAQCRRGARGRCAAARCCTEAAAARPGATLHQTCQWVTDSQTKNSGAPPGGACAPGPPRPGPATRARPARGGRACPAAARRPIQLYAWRASKHNKPPCQNY
jgi:hypothetical protein